MASGARLVENIAAQRWRRSSGEVLTGTASQFSVARLVPDANGETDLGRREVTPMSQPMGDRRPLVALPGEREAVTGLPIVVRARAAETGGTFEVYELGIPGEREGLDAGPPPHTHREHEEVFYVLEGEIEFFLDDDHAAAPAGTLVVVPRGTRHSFRGTSGSRLLVVAIPGGLAGFFEELGAGHAAGRADAEIRAGLAGKYDSYPEAS